MAMLRRRDFLRAVTAGAALVVPLRPFLACAQAPVKIGTAVLGDYGLAGSVTIALEKGFFKAEGLDVEFIPFRGGPNLVKAVIAGDVLLGVTGATDVLVFREAGMPIKAVATHTEGNHFTLNVAPEITKVGDLKGKAIGVTAPGSNTWVLARMVAKQQGWDPDRDIQVVALGGLDAQAAALVRKEIHAYVFGDSGAVMEQQGKSKILMRLDTVTPKWISMVQYATEDGIRRNADGIRKGIRGIFRAFKFMKANPKETAEIVSKKLGWTPEAVLGAHRITSPLFPADGRINGEALQVMQDTLLEHGVIRKRLPLEEHYSNDFTPVKV